MVVKFIAVYLDNSGAQHFADRRIDEHFIFCE